MPVDEKPPVVLIIDDEPSLRMSLRSFMEDYDYQVLEAKNGRIGLETFQREGADLILLDLHMPEMTGLQVMERISQDSPDTPIIIITGTGVLNDAIQALRLGAWDYLLKPILDLSVLLHTAEKCLERARLIRENRLYKESLEDKVAQRTTELENANLELHQTNNRLRENQATLDSIFRVAPTGIGLAVNHILKRTNQRLCEMVGYSDHELLEKSTGILYPNEEEIERAWQERYRQMKEYGTCTVETQWKRKNGDIIDVLLSSTPLDNQDFSQGTTFTALDITRSKQAEEELKKHRDHLEELVDQRTVELSKANSELSQYAYFVSHDLKILLRAR
ncbi:MAG: response regulator [Proteobacteria bacterium]|nr:response regulator [Pseudomonadota bacterium]